MDKLHNVRVTFMRFGFDWSAVTIEHVKRMETFLQKLGLKIDSRTGSFTVAAVKKVREVEPGLTNLQTLCVGQSLACFYYDYLHGHLPENGYNLTTEYAKRIVSCSVFKQLEAADQSAVLCLQLKIAAIIGDYISVRNAAKAKAAGGVNIANLILRNVR